jgi:hypothetical protein
MAHLRLGFKTFISVLRAGPWGHPIVAHHHLHKD